MRAVSRRNHDCIIENVNSRQHCSSAYFLLLWMQPMRPCMQAVWLPSVTVSFITAHSQRLLVQLQRQIDDHDVTTIIAHAISRPVLLSRGSKENAYKRTARKIHWWKTQERNRLNNNNNNNNNSLLVSAYFYFTFFGLLRFLHDGLTAKSIVFQHFLSDFSYPRFYEALK